MKNKFNNSTFIQGRLYDHKLEEKVTGANSKTPGVTYIAGTVSVATDDAITNIVDVYYTFVKQKNNNGTDNKNYAALKNIINGVYKTVLGAGANAATLISINSKIGLNEFYSDKNGEKKLVSAKRNDGGFINVITGLNPDESKRNTFNVDMLITSVISVEADDEKDLPAKATIKGYIFDDYRKSCLPVEFSALRDDAMNYFLSLEASKSNPVFTYLKGNEISTVVKKVLTTGGAFSSEVREVSSTRKDYVIDWAAAEPYVFGDESFLTKEEFEDMLRARETMKAELEARFDARTTMTSVPASKTVTPASKTVFTPAASAVSSDGFDW